MTDLRIPTFPLSPRDVWGGALQEDLLALDDGIAATAVAADAAYVPTGQAGTEPNPVRVTTLIAGQDDETTLGNHATIAADTVNFTVGDRAWKVTNNSTTPELWVTYSTPLQFPTTATAICARVYIPDVTKVTDITLQVFCDATFTVGNRWSRGIAAEAAVHPALVNGWNTLRFHTQVSTRGTGWGSCYRAVVSGTSSVAGATFTVGHMWIESRAKASLIVINDGPYRDFLTNAYPALKDRAIPVTWAVDPSLLGTFDVKQRMSQAELDSVAFENGNSVSIHAWGDTQTSGMTAAQIRADVTKTVKWAQGKGYTGQVWRAAWWGNSAPNSRAADGLLLAAAMNSSITGPTTWPPIDRHNIARYNLDTSRTDADVNALFAGLQSTRGLCLLYFHAVITPVLDSFDATLAQFNNFLANVDAGVSAGWLECVTFEQLYARSGGVLRQGFGGGQIAEFTDENGAAVRQQLP